MASLISYVTGKSTATVTWVLHDVSLNPSNASYVVTKDTGEVWQSGSFNVTGEYVRIICRDDSVGFAQAYKDHWYKINVTDGFGLSCVDYVTVRVNSYVATDFADWDFEKWNAECAKGENGFALFNLRGGFSPDQDWWYGKYEQAPRGLCNRPSGDFWISVHVTRTSMFLGHGGIALFGGEDSVAFWGFYNDFWTTSLKYERFKSSACDFNLWVPKNYGLTAPLYDQRIGLRFTGTGDVIFSYYDGGWLNSTTTFSLPFNVSKIGLFCKEWEESWFESGSSIFFNDIRWGYL